MDYDLTKSQLYRKVKEHPLYDNSLTWGHKKALWLAKLRELVIKENANKSDPNRSRFTTDEEYLEDRRRAKEIQLRNSRNLTQRNKILREKLRAAIGGVTRGTPCCEECRVNCVLATHTDKSCVGYKLCLMVRSSFARIWIHKYQFITSNLTGKNMFSEYLLVDTTIEDRGFLPKLPVLSPDMLHYPHILEIPDACVERRKRSKQKYEEALQCIGDLSAIVLEYI
jgi:hypothetical protein